MNIPAEIHVNGKWRPTRNSEGRLIHSTPEGLLAFWKWFGESKIVDDQGRPLVVYHGTEARFGEFADNEAFLSFDRDVAESYGSIVMEVYVKAERILESSSADDILMAMRSDEVGLTDREVDALGYKGKDTQDILWLTAGARGSAGATHAMSNLWTEYDAVVFTDDVNTRGGELRHSTLFVPFSGDQIKSATGNRGTFDGADPVLTNPRRRRQR